MREHGRKIFAVTFVLLIAAPVAGQDVAPATSNTVDEEVFTVAPDTPVTIREPDMEITSVGPAKSVVVKDLPSADQDPGPPVATPEELPFGPIRPADVPPPSE